jgi:tRNA(His) 5'-end guanylyltransferase
MTHPYPLFNIDKSANNVIYEFIINSNKYAIDISLILLFCSSTLILFLYMIKPLFYRNENKYKLNYPDICDKLPVNLDERIKYYEKQSQTITQIGPEYPFIIRLDGRAFTKFTKQFKKINKDIPYSIEFKTAMIKTCHDLLHEFNPSTVYTHSDEITMIFNSAIVEDNIHQHIFGGKVFKLLSLISAFASVRFNANLNIQKNDSTFNTKVKINENPTFDAIVIVFPKSYEIVNHMMWRSKGDCTRNFISMFAEKFIPKKQLQHMNLTTRIENLQKIGINLSGENIDYSLKHGIFIKKCSPTINGEIITNFYVFKNYKFAEDMLNFLLCDHGNKYNMENLSSMNPIVYDITNYNELFIIPSYQ